MLLAASSRCYIVIYTFMQHHNDTTIKTQEGRHSKTSLTTYLPLTLLQGFERVVQGFACERMLETEHKLHILTPLLMTVTLCLSWSPDAQPGPWGPLHRGFSEGPLGRVWLSLPHLVSSCLEFYWQLLWDQNSTELNNNSTPTRSPTGSLKSNV